MGDYSIIISLLAFAFSIYAWAKARKQERQKEELNDFGLKEAERTEEARKRAGLMAYASNGRIVIRNNGLADARDVCMECSEDFPMRIPDDFFPYPKLVSGQELQVPYLREYIDNTHQTVTLIWNDESGDGRRLELSLSLRSV